MDGRKALHLGGWGAFFMRSCPALPGLFSRSDFAAVTGKSLAPQRKKIPVDNPKIVNPGFNLPRTRFFSGYLILNISGAFLPVSPVNATKRMLFCCVHCVHDTIKQAVCQVSPSITPLQRNIAHFCENLCYRDSCTNQSIVILS